MYEKTGRALKKHNSVAHDDELQCYVGKLSNTNSIFMVDSNDIDIVSKYCWYENNYGYAITRVGKTRQILLHRLIMFGVDGGEASTKVDHINRNRLDCRRSNLRTCADAENALNRSVSSRNKSGVTGVIWRPNEGKWQAYICQGRKSSSLGYYKNKNDAISARIIAEQNLFKEFAPQHDIL